MTPEERERIIQANHDLVKNCKPEKVFGFFADLASIPRESGNVGKVGEFLETFARERKLESLKDSTGNVIIRKPAQHMESKSRVILQAHQDMVCVKTGASSHDFEEDPIEFVLDGDWLKANGTTLGADDGIGVALALAVLDAEDIPHPRLEALFTVDEETDMKGAKEVSEKDLEGTTLINLDAEDINIAYISSAAGVSSVLELPLAADANGGGTVFRKIVLDGLLGGHSGIEIHKARANAYVLLARFLAAAVAEEGIEYTLHAFEQGEGRGADNAIPDRAVAVVSLQTEAAAEALEKMASIWTKTFYKEYRSSDPGVCLQVGSATEEETGLPALDGPGRDRLLRLIRLIPLGVFRFIQTKDLLDRPYGELLVETSCNMGIARIAEGKASLSLLARGSTDSALKDLMARISDLALLVGGVLRETNSTQGWEMPEKPTPVQELFSAQGLECRGVHAGLECGCLVSNFALAGRTLDAISVGPDLKDVHSPKECLGITSVQTLWTQLLAVLANMG